MQDSAQAGSLDYCLLPAPGSRQASMRKQESLNHSVARRSVLTGGYIRQEFRQDHEVIEVEAFLFEYY